nr:CDP-diacylglycerol--glycerol-3-phosphate 3-phosphatidyltransferase [bacterium]
MGIANKLTLLRILLVPVILAFTLFDAPWGWFVAAGLFILASITDLVDGYLARSMNQVSNFGKLMDPIADKLIVVSVMLILNDAGLLSIWITLVVVAREFWISGIRLLAATEGGRVVAASWWGKIKTITQCIGLPMLMVAAGGVEKLFGFFPLLPIGGALMVISAAVALIGGIDYTVKNYGLIHNRAGAKEAEHDG